MQRTDESFVLNNYSGAFENGAIKPFFQPIIRTLTHELCAAETLARWDDPLYGVISPADFIGKKTFITESVEKRGYVNTVGLIKLLSSDPIIGFDNDIYKAEEEQKVGSCYPLALPKKAIRGGSLRSPRSRQPAKRSICTVCSRYPKVILVRSKEC